MIVTAGRVARWMPCASYVIDSLALGKSGLPRRLTFLKRDEPENTFWTHAQGAVMRLNEVVNLSVCWLVFSLLLGGDTLHTLLHSCYWFLLDLLSTLYSTGCPMNFGSTSQRWRMCVSERVHVCFPTWRWLLIRLAVNRLCMSQNCIVSNLFLMPTVHCQQGLEPPACLLCQGVVDNGSINRHLLP